MRFGVLGPVCVTVRDGPVPLAGRLRAGLLALLLARPNQPVPVESLLDALWGDGDPAGVPRLQTSVAKLRRMLDTPDRLTFDAGGYRLRVAPGELDADRFDALVADAAAGTQDGRRTELLREADGLWRGLPYQGLDLGALAAPAQRLLERRYVALEDLYTAELERGRHRDVVGELSDLADRHPLRERLQTLLLTALYRCDRRADALAVYRRTREAVVDELGLEPGPELREAERRALDDLDPATGALARSAPPVQVPGAPADFVGRRAALDGLCALGRVVVVAGVRASASRRWSPTGPEAAGTGSRTGCCTSTCRASGRTTRCPPPRRSAGSCAPWATARCRRRSAPTSAPRGSAPSPPAAGCSSCWTTRRRPGRYGRCYRRRNCPQSS